MKRFEHYKILETAALSGGKVLTKYFRKEINVRYKGKRDVNPVSIADEESEQEIIKVLKKAYPGFGMLCEESCNTLSVNEEYYWIIDPLDGTVNYLYRIPIFCISIALVKLHFDITLERFLERKFHGAKPRVIPLEEMGAWTKKREIIAGIVYNPINKEIFYAEKNKGAYLNGKKIHVSKRRKLSESILVTGFPYDARGKYKWILGKLYKLLLTVQGIRRFGSAALDLANVAQGQIDVFWESELKPWDVAAGSLLVEEAGGKITDGSGGDNYLFGDGIIASNGLIHKETLKIIRQKNSIRH